MPEIESRARFAPRRRRRRQGLERFKLRYQIVDSEDQRGHPELTASPAEIEQMRSQFVVRGQES